MIDWAWIADHLDELAGRTLQHLYLTAVSVAIGFVIAFGLAVWSIRRRAVYRPILGITGLLYTIPSLALFPLLVPVTGLTDVTAITPLVLYSLLIFVRNMVAGFDAVPPDILEAADGSGYSGGGRFWSIEVPLAVPLLIAGVRLATVSTIALVNISGLLGDRFGGLGFFIFEGIRHSFPTEIFFGGLGSIALAVAADVALVAVQRRLTPWSRATREDVPSAANARAAAS